VGLEFQSLIICFFCKGKKRKRTKNEQEKQNLEMKDEEVDKTEKQKAKKRPKIDNTQTQNNSNSSKLNPNSKMSKGPNNEAQSHQDNESVSEDILPEVVSFHQAKVIASQQRQEELQALKRSRMRIFLLNDHEEIFTRLILLFTVKNKRKKKNEDVILNDFKNGVN
jgi:hypothetical protein